MATEQTCIICQIQQNKLTHFLIAERDGFKAVLDKYPIAEGHILILSPSHASHLEHCLTVNMRLSFNLRVILGSKCHMSMMVFVITT